MALDDRGAVVLPGEGKTISFSGTTFSGNRLRFLYAEPHSAHSVVEFAAAPDAPSTPLHVHRATDETAYVLEGTYGLQMGAQTLELTEGTFVFVPKGVEHAFWNAGTSPARVLSTISPAGFERYFEELAEGLATVGADEEASMSLREELSEKYDIEVVGPPRRGLRASR